MFEIQRFTSSDCKDKGNRQFECVTTHFLYPNSACEYFNI